MLLYICHPSDLPRTCFGRIPLDFHPVEGLCGSGTLRQRRAARVQMRDVERRQWIGAPGECAALLVPAFIGHVCVLQLTQRRCSCHCGITLTMLGHYRRRNVARVNERAALGEAVYFLVEGVVVVKSLGLVAGGACPVSDTQRLVWAWLGLRDPVRRGCPARHKALIGPAVVNAHCARLEIRNPVVRVERPDRARTGFPAYHRIV